MCSRLTCIFLFLVAMLQPSLAQMSREGGAQVELRVNVVYDINDRPVASQVRVQLLVPSGSVLGEQIVTDLGQVEFLFVNQFPHNYRLRVDGEGIVPMTTEVFAIPSHNQAHWETVRVHAKRSGPDNAENSSTQMVAAAELNVPNNARKEYEKGTQALEKRDWEEAGGRFKKATELYPKYAAAYNNLGVVYMNTRQAQKAQESFGKAIESDDHYARAYVNLAMALYVDRKPVEAEPLLQKARALNPLDAQALTLLAQIELQGGRAEEALGTARRVHAVPHDQYTVAHLIAARACELLHKETDAMAEYTIFLKESPQDPYAPKARATLDALKARTH